MSGLPLYLVDAFTAAPFRGNPAAVCLLEREADAAWMQKLAAEMNQAETAYVWPRQDGGFGLRWFTPKIEVDLCGHATLASAQVLWETGRVGWDSEIPFHTRSGVLACLRRGEWTEMDFPAKIAQPKTAPAALLSSLGAPAVAAAGNGMDFLVELATAAEVRSLQPDFPTIAKLPVRGLIVTAVSDRPEYDYVSRFFAPGAGVPEDPATGSAHCCLAPYWSPRLGKTNLVGHQASQRGAVIRTRLVADRVVLIGQAVLVLEGHLRP